MDNPNSFDNAVESFRRYDKIFVAAHILPDGDCLGSALGLTWALRKIGKTVTITCYDHVSNAFEYLPGFAELSPKVPTDEQFLVYVDGSSADRFGAAFDPKIFNGRPVLAIDHHITNEHFAPMNLVDKHAASTAEIIYRLIRALQVPLDPTIAQCLLTGIITDTLGFRTANTTVETLKTATALMEAGASIPDIVDRSFNQIPLPNLRLRGRVFSDAHLDGIILWAEIPLKLLRELGVNGNGTGGIINQLLSVDAAKIAVLLVEKDSDRIEVSLRARQGYDVSGIAKRLGGGGHRLAAAATLLGPIETVSQRVLSEVRRELGYTYPNAK